MGASMPGVPDRHHTVCPYLVVPDAADIITFMKEAFGATDHFLHRTPEGDA